MAEALEESEKRLFLAAYMNTLESLRQLSQWRMSADPAVTKYATFPVVEGLVIQARVSQSLQILVRDLEPEIRRIHDGLTIVTEVSFRQACKKRGGRWREGEATGGVSRD